MKESISTTFIFYLMIVFILILIMFFVGSISYSKAYKVKNRIVEVIENEQGYPGNPETPGSTSAVDEIEDWLKYGGQNGTGIGYRLNTNANGKTNCPSPEKYNLPADAENVTVYNDYEYCVYKIHDCDEYEENIRCGDYYHVVAYMYFDLPIINKLIKLPVEGETMTFTEVNTIGRGSD